MPGQSVPNPGRESLANALFLAARANLYGFWVAESNPRPEAVLAFLLYFLGPGGMRLGQVKPGVDQDVDALLCGLKQRQP